MEKESLKDDIHKPAENWGTKKNADKMKEKLERAKNRREISSKLGFVVYIYYFIPNCLNVYIHDWRG